MLKNFPSTHLVLGGFIFLPIQPSFRYSKSVYPRRTALLLIINHFQSRFDFDNYVTDIKGCVYTLAQLTYDGRCVIFSLKSPSDWPSPSPPFHTLPYPLARVIHLNDPVLKVNQWLPSRRGSFAGLNKFFMWRATFISSITVYHYSVFLWIEILRCLWRTVTTCRASVSGTKSSTEGVKSIQAQFERFFPTSCLESHRRGGLKNYMNI